MQVPKSKSSLSKERNKNTFSILIQKTLTGTHQNCANGNYHHSGELDDEKMPFFLLIAIKPLSLINSFLGMFPCNFYL